MARRGSEPSRRQGSRLPGGFFERDSDYELYEEDGEFVLSVELPGFDPEEIDLAWDDGMLGIAAEQEDDRRGETRTYHRRFRFPRDVDDESITAEYTSGILNVRLPVQRQSVSGREIEIQS